MTDCDKLPDKSVHTELGERAAGTGRYCSIVLWKDDEWVKKCIDSEAEGVNLILEILR